MLDIKWITENPEKLDAALKNRGAAPLSAELIALDEARKAHIAKTQDAQTRRNAASKEIGMAKGKGDEETAQRLMAEVAEIKAFLASAEEEEKNLTHALNDALARIPNIPKDDVPVGADENDNVEVKRVGEPPKIEAAKEHHELGEGLGLMDFEAAARISGARFVVLKGALARLERALGQFMIDVQTSENGYTEVSPPVLVRSDALYGTGQLPKFEEDLFKTTADHYLIPTAEVSLTNLVREEMLDAASLPMRLVALTPCFRSEAGSAGRDTRGMIRQHQFTKCELVTICHPEKSDDEQEHMLASAESILQKLGLAYRVIVLCTGDMGFGAQKTYDIEVWLPGQGTYREISSVSTCGDFQARRMKARFRDENGKPQFLHTLNGSGLAVGRTLVAVLENYQQPDGTIVIPEVLRPYMGGQSVIAKG